MDCPKCQFENRDGAKFCNQYGCDLIKAVETHSGTYNEPQSFKKILNDTTVDQIF